MYENTGPRRTVSTATNVSIIAEIGLPAWVPPYNSTTGHFNNITRYDTGVPMIGMEIDPDQFMQDGSPTPYPDLFYANSGFQSSWDSQAGGCYAPNLGEHGSMIVCAGGHSTFDFMGVVRFDIATGVFSHHYFPPYSALEKSVDGGTVATLTGTVTNRKSLDLTAGINDRVNSAGGYIKTADDVLIPGCNLDPNLTTVWHPGPIHSNAGIHVVPADGGGGPNGTLVLNGHDQSGIRVLQSEMSIFSMDLTGVVWQRYNHGLGEQPGYATPGLEWDSKNKVMWHLRVSGTPWAMKFPERTRRTISSPSFNWSGGYCPNACFMPDRDLMVSMINSGPDELRENMVANQFTTPIQINTTDTGRYRVLSLGMDFSNTSSLMTFQKSFDSATGPTWIDIATYNTDSGRDYLWATDRQYDTTADRAEAVSLGKTSIWYRLGFKTGDYGTGAHDAWMHCRIPRLQAWDVSGFNFNLANQTLPSFTIPNTQDYWTQWPRDDGNLMFDVGGPSHPHGVNDRLEYCSHPDDICLFFVDRPLTTTSGPRVGPKLNYINLWKLRPPPVATQQTAQWLWEKEVIQDGTPGLTGVGMFRSSGFPSFAGRTKYIPSLKVIVINDRPERPIQCIRSKAWA